VHHSSAQLGNLPGQLSTPVCSWIPFSLLGQSVSHSLAYHSLACDRTASGLVWGHNFAAATASVDRELSSVRYHLLYVMLHDILCYSTLAVFKRQSTGDIPCKLLRSCHQHKEASAHTNILCASMLPPTLLLLLRTASTLCLQAVDELLLLQQRGCVATLLHQTAIHSATANAWCLQAFDELLLLQRGGSTLYCGPVGENSRDLVWYFENLGVESIEPGYNPATWMLENTTASVEEKKDVSFAEAFEKSDLKRSVAKSQSYSHTDCMCFQRCGDPLCVHNAHWCTCIITNATDAQQQSLLHCRIS